MFAQQPPPPQAGPPAGTVEGRVVNEITGEGVRKARINLFLTGGGGPGGRRGGPPPPGAQIEGMTSADGSFRIDNVPPGSYRFWAERASFVYRRDPRRNDQALLEVGPGAVARVPDIKLSPAAVITGRVTDEDGDPVQGVTVQVNRYQYAGGKKQLIPQQSGSTNDLGEFRIHSILPGRYFLSASKSQGPPGPRGPSRPMPSNGPEQSYVTVFFPGTLDPGAAAPLDLAPGQEYRGADVRLSKTQVFRVRGVVSNLVSDPKERGWPSAVVYLYPDSAIRNMIAERRPSPIDTRTGAFEIRNVRPGSYYLVAQQAGGDHSLSGDARIEVGAGDVADVRVALSPNVPVKGRVAVEGTAQVDLRSLALQLVPTSGFSSYGPPVRISEDGSFQARNVPRVPHRVIATNLPEGFWVKAVQMDGRDAPDNVIAAASLVDVKLAPGAASVAGIVRDAKGDPVEGIKVTVAPEGTRSGWWELYRETTSSKDGSYRLANLPPGSYRVYAWEKLELGAHQDAKFLEPFESQSSPVALKEGETATVHPKPIAPPAGVL